MRKIKNVKTKLVLILSAMLSSSILLSSCSNVIPNGDNNSNIEKPVPSIDLEIKNVGGNTNLENEFDIFLKNIGNNLEIKNVGLNVLNWSNKEILTDICNVVNTKNIINFDKEVKYNFELNELKLENNKMNYKIILKIDSIEEVKSINFFGKSLNKIDGSINNFLFFENVNRVEDTNTDDLFTKKDIDILVKEVGVDGKALITVVGDMKNFYDSKNSFHLLVKHLYNLGIYNINALRFDNSSNDWKIRRGDIHGNEIKNQYNIDIDIYDYVYFIVHDQKGIELETLLKEKYSNKKFDIIISNKFLPKIAFKVSKTI